MAWTRHISQPLCSAGLSLVMAVLLLGQLGIGGPIASLAKQRCGARCVCDGDESKAHAESEAHDGCDHGGVARRDAEAGPNNEAPCNDEAPCKDNCPDCSCSTSLVANVASFTVLGMTRSLSVTKRFAAVDAPASGSMSSVFRPPRLLS